MMGTKAESAGTLNRPAKLLERVPMSVLYNGPEGGPVSSGRSMGTGTGQSLALKKAPERRGNSSELQVDGHCWELCRSMFT